MEKFESLEKTIIREFREETGYTIKALENMGVRGTRFIRCYWVANK
ncbi:NUDIX domain-containing protein [Paenibacillus agricola]|nr:NUDIX domain-containing protein [Paenibacillus agricola]